MKDTWVALKSIFSNNLLVFAVRLLPKESAQRRELAEFLLGYMKRGLRRVRTACAAADGKGEKG